jgi:outer membrane lipoprotein SlyB
MNLKKIINGVLIAACGFMLAHCSKEVTPGDYDAAEVGQVKKVISGSIVSMRPVRLHSRGQESLAGGSVETGYADNSLNRDHGFEYVIRLNSGSIISVVQTENTKLKPKQRVLVIYGENTRVVPDEGADN